MLYIRHHILLVSSINEDELSGHTSIAHMTEVRMHKHFSRKTDGNRPLGRLGRRWECD
jgi:hypothetical protein